MINVTKALEIINFYLENKNNSIKDRYFPISVHSLTMNDKLCDELIDFFGDIYTCIGLDSNYEENIQGAEIQEIIHLLAFFRGQLENDKTGDGSVS